jgi:hypothetical protein
MDPAAKSVFKTVLTLRMEGLPTQGTVILEFSPLLPNAQIYLPPDSPCLQLDTQTLGTPVLLQYVQLQPRRLQLDLADSPDTLVVALAVTCDQPFLYGWLQVLDSVRTALSTHVETVKLQGSSFWALPMGDVSADHHPTNPPESGAAA